MEEIVMGDGMTVKLVTAWLPVSWDTVEDCAAADVVALVSSHQEHDLVVNNSAFGWREIRCQSCDEVLWSVRGG